MSPPPPYTRLDPAERRDQILDTANTLFAERGYEEVSIEDIAKEAGITRGLIHHYFGGRKEVYIALLERLEPSARKSCDPRGSKRSCARGGLGIALARLDGGEPNDLPRGDGTR